MSRKLCTNILFQIFFHIDCTAFYTIYSNRIYSIEHVEKSRRTHYDSTQVTSNVKKPVQ